jgi:hypothetical protein
VAVKVLVPPEVLEALRVEEEARLCGGESRPAWRGRLLAWGLGALRAGVKLDI